MYAVIQQVFPMQLARFLVFLSLCRPLAADELPRVEILALKDTSISHRLHLDGTIYPHRQATLASEVSGTIEQQPTRIGQYVAKGDTLLYLDPQVFVLQHALRSAELDAASSLHTLAEQDWQRVRQLHEDGTATEQELQNATFQRDRAAAQKKAANTALQMAQLEWMKSSLRAPFGGEVAALYAEIGETVSAGQPLVRLAATDSVQVHASVSASEVLWLEQGLPARITPSDGSAPFYAEVRSFSRVADPQSHRYPVELQAHNEGTRSFGALAEIELTTRRPLRGVLVSESALRSFAGITYAYIVDRREDGIFLRQTVVTIGRELPGGQFLITGGLSAGQVVATGGSLMADGLQVRIAASLGLQP